MKLENKNISQLKAQANKLFSEYIRRKNADLKGNARCVTCNKTFHWKELQCGHFIQGRHNMVLFCEQNAHCQCYVCNVLKHGNLIEYTLFMQQTYGQEVIDQLKRMDSLNKQWTKKELINLIKDLQNKLAKL